MNVPSAQNKFVHRNVDDDFDAFPGEHSFLSGGQLQSISFRISRTVWTMGATFQVISTNYLPAEGKIEITPKLLPRTFFTADTVENRTNFTTLKNYGNTPKKSEPSPKRLQFYGWLGEKSEKIAGAISKVNWVPPRLGLPHVHPGQGCQASYGTLLSRAK